MREKYCSLAEKVRLISEANSASGGWHFVFSSFLCPFLFMLFSSFGWSSVIIVHLCLKSGEFGSGSMVRFGDGGGGCAGKSSFYVGFL